MKQWGGFCVGDKVRFIGEELNDTCRPPFGTIGVVEEGLFNDETSIRVKWPSGSLGVERDWSYIALRVLEHAEQSGNLIAPAFEELTGFKEE